MTSVALGAAIREAREARGLSVRAAAQACGCAPSHYQRLEGGVVEKPSPDVLRRLAGGLGARYEVLLRAAGYL